MKQDIKFEGVGNKRGYPGENLGSTYPSLYGSSNHPGNLTSGCLILDNVIFLNLIIERLDKKNRVNFGTLISK